jgi:hypothetical protein
MDYPACIFNELIKAYRYPVQISYTVLHRIRSRNMESTGKILPYVNRGCGSYFAKLILARQLLLKNLHNKFHENLTNGLAADTRSQAG